VPVKGLPDSPKKENMIYLHYVGLFVNTLVSRMRLDCF